MRRLQARSAILRVKELEANHHLPRRRCTFRDLTIDSDDVQVTNAELTQQLKVSLCKMFAGSEQIVAFDLSLL